MTFSDSAFTFLKQRVPILQWGPNYTTNKLISDLIAGFTVGLTVMPQALAYATLGGLEPQVKHSFNHQIVDKKVLIFSMVYTQRLSDVLFTPCSGAAKILPLGQQLLWP